MAPATTVHTRPVADFEEVRADAAVLESVAVLRAPRLVVRGENVDTLGADHHADAALAADLGE